MTYAEFVAEVRACLDGRVWQHGYEAYQRLFRALGRAEATLAKEESK